MTQYPTRRNGRQIDRSIKNAVRQRQLCGIVFIASLFLIFALLFTVFITAGKGGPNQTAESKYFTSIQIEEGDSLYSIANTYMTSHYSSSKDYIREVKHINHLEENTIHAGEYLIIPYYGEINN